MKKLIALAIFITSIGTNFVVETAPRSPVNRFRESIKRLPFAIQKPQRLTTTGHNPVQLLITDLERLGYTKSPKGRSYFPAKNKSVAVYALRQGQPVAVPIFQKQSQPTISIPYTYKHKDRYVTKCKIELTGRNNKQILPFKYTNSPQIGQKTDMYHSFPTETDEYIYRHGIETKVKDRFKEGVINKKIAIPGALIYPLNEGHRAKYGNFVYIFYPNGDSWVCFHRCFEQG